MSTYHIANLSTCNYVLNIIFMTEFKKKITLGPFLHDTVSEIAKSVIVLPGPTLNILSELPSETRLICLGISLFIHQFLSLSNLSIQNCDQKEMF